MPTTRPFRQVDVFGARPFAGNPLAVVHDAVGLTDEQMADVSAWTNLSECTFLLPPTDPGADYRVRIFAGRRELPFAGHPTLGTAAAWLDAGGSPAVAGRVVQECGVGLVTVREIAEGAGGEGRDGDGAGAGGAAADAVALAFEAPSLLRSGTPETDERDAVVRTLGLEADADAVLEVRWIDNGPGWIGVLLRDADAVLAVRPEPARDGVERSIGVVGLRAEALDGEPRVEIRALIVDGEGGLVEDPVTGSLNASAAQWLIDTGRVSAPFTAAQGRMVGHDGRVSITRDAGGALWVGGAAVVAIRGEIGV
ncbi:PhzF family phenazine biosynthesis protein [Litorihabitans aurantiacus]|nr:PhzF family phenazine biosynthesis protein [Litorihabitans aurantiacus]